MYMPYLMYGYAATLGLMLLGCRVTARSVPGLRGVRLLSGALFFGLVGVVLMALRPYAPTWATILLANGLVLMCPLLIYCAAADILGVAARFFGWGMGLALAAVVAVAYFTYIDPELRARILISSVVWAIYAAVTGWMLFRHREAENDRAEPGFRLRSLIVALVWLQVGTITLHVARFVLTLFYPPVSFLHIDLIEAGFTYLNMLLNVGCSCGLIWLALCAQRRDLHTMALTDGLTGLLNRRAFEEILGRELRRSNFGGRRLTVLLLDIDRFKNVNDCWGHQAGDAVLRRVSAALQDCMRPSDALARYGGEEFVMLLRDLTPAQAGAVAERLRESVAGLDSLPGDISITASIGMDSSRLYDTPEAFLERCDKALYQSKHAGRNLVTVYRTTSRHKSSSRPRLA